MGHTTQNAAVLTRSKCQGQPTEPTCTVVQSGATQEARQGVLCFAGLAAENVGTRGICMQLVTIPPGGRAQPHLHAHHETAIYVLSGEAEMWYGAHLQQRLVVQSGDFLYIPADMPHMPVNRSQTAPCIAVVARTDPRAHESVVLLPELDRAD